MSTGSTRSGGTASVEVAGGAATDRGGRLTVVTHVLASADYGGAERVAAALALALRARRGIAVDVVAPAGGAAERMLRELGAAPRVFDLDGLLGPARLRSAREALRIVGGPPYGRRRLVHFHAPFVYGAARRGAWFAPPACARS